MAEDGSLKIQKLAMEDGGMFQCVASNSAGQATAYTWLKVKSKSYRNKRKKTRKRFKSLDHHPLCPCV